MPIEIVVAGSKPEHFQKGTQWIRARLVDAEGMEVGADAFGAARVVFTEITVASRGKVFATIETNGRRKERVQPHYLASRGYRASKAEAVFNLLARASYHRDRALRNLTAAEAAVALVAAWKEEP